MNNAPCIDKDQLRFYIYDMCFFLEVCLLNLFLKILAGMPNSVDPDQTAV